MANSSNQIEILLKEQETSARTKISNVRSAVGNVPNGERDLAILLKRLDSLSNITDKTTKDIKDYARAIQALNKFTMKVSETMGKVPETIKKAQEVLENLAKDLNRTKTGYSHAAIGRHLSAQGVTNAKGEKISSADYIANISGQLSSNDPKVQATAQQRVAGWTVNGGSFIDAYNSEIAAGQARAQEYNNVAQQIEAQTVQVTDAQLYLDAAKANIDIDNLARQAGSESSGSGGGGSLEDEGPTRQLDTSTTALNKQSSSLGKAFKQFTLYAIALRTAKKALREAVSTIKELDRSLTEQAMVTGMTRKQTYGLLKDYQDMASRLGATTKEVSSTMTEFLRQGRSITEASKLTEAAVSAAKVAGISAADSINYLTTAVNGFQLSATEAMKVSDKFAAVAASAAASYEEVAIALSKVAAQANLAGMSIDYTTALLTKGIETTREAPETIGTALKTVIARMREMGDYGETLEGDTDVNNVETQLAYIGIQLRNNNGELRSTEDVLNELGKQWDQLNANQQAAIAKALAGTRQQSRLIAMMQDYERVIELQEISERSAGATMAQMATYMEGMDAALNKVNVAWETLVSNIVESDAVIALVTFAGETINTIAENLWVLIPLAAGLVISSGQILNNKIREAQLSKLQVQITTEQAKVSSKLNKELSQRIVKEKEIALKKDQQLLTDTQAIKHKSAADKKLIAELQARIPQEEAELAIEKSKVDYYEAESKYLESSSSAVTDLTAKWEGLGGSIASVFMSAIPGLLQLITQTQAATAAKKAHTAATKEAEIAEKSEGRTSAAGSAAKIPYVGWIIWAIIMGAGIISAVYSAIKTFNSLTKDTTEQINELSKNIYELNKKSTGLDTAIDKFDDLDKKIIKTKKDIEDMNSILDSAADSLSNEEKETYNKLTTMAERRRYLAGVKASTVQELANARAKQLGLIGSYSGSEYSKFLSSNESGYVQARDAMYALNNSALYNYIDNIENLKEGTQEMVQALIESFSAEKALNLLRNQSKLEDYIHQVQKGVDVFMDESKTLRERTDAFKELNESVTDPELRQAMRDAYGDWYELIRIFDSSIDYIDKMGITIDELNDLSLSLQKLGYTANESAEYLNALFETLSNGGKLADAIEGITGLARGTEEYTKVLNAFEKAVGMTLLNAGQEIDKFNNKIDSFYKTATEWSTMSESDRTKFLSENQDMFTGEQGKVLRNALNTGNYAAIRDALANNEALDKERQLLIQNLEIQLEIERSREEVNYATIAELEKQKALLEDINNIYLASLETRKKQQDAQIEEYKNLLQAETDALVASLEKRKEAYQKYFDAINEKAEEQEYEDKAQMLIANLSKLGSSSNADAVAKQADLQRQLEELEKERLETLRQQAQEQIIQNIDDQISQTNENLEKILNSEQAILTAILGETSSPEKLIASLVASQWAQGTDSELGLQSYLEGMKATFSSIMPDVDWDDIKVERRGDSTVLNINNQEVVLTDSEQKTVADAVQEALKQIGKN